MRANPAQKWKYACKKPEADIVAGKKQTIATMD